MKAPGPGASIPCLVASILLLTALSGHLCLSAAPQKDSSSVLSADPRFKHGHQLVEQGRFSEAAAQFKELQEFFPGSPLLFNLLGFCNLQQGFRDLAIQDFQKAIALQPEFKPAHNNLAGIYLSQGRTRDAISEFEEVVRIDPKDSQDYFNLARAELAVNDRRSGLEYLNKAYALAPANVAVTMALAQLDLEDGHLEAALDVWRELAKSDPSRNVFLRWGGAAGDLRVRRNRAVAAKYKVQISGFALCARTGKEFEAPDRR